MLVRGEEGYYPVVLGDDDPDAAKVEKWVDEKNALLGVDVYQREAMLNGSMFGWDQGGADPDIVKEYMNGKSDETRH